MPIAIRRRGLASLGLLAFQKASAQSSLLAAFPQHPPEMVRETVGVSHGNLKRLKELVDARPALARAAVDWGFGDWEDALGAASHVGNREIAEYLIAHGARPTIFSAVMLGQLEVVRAFVAAQPGIQRIPGPHSISLLAHARAGGVQARPVFDYLTALGDADAPPLAPLTAEEAKSLTGIYSYGPTPEEQIEVAEKAGRLTLARKGGTARGLFHVGDHAFHPVGAAHVRVRFFRQDEDKLLNIHDPGVILTAKRL